MSFHYNIIIKFYFIFANFIDFCNLPVNLKLVDNLLFDDYWGRFK